MSAFLLTATILLQLILGTPHPCHAFASLASPAKTSSILLLRQQQQQFPPTITSCRNTNSYRRWNTRVAGLNPCPSRNINKFGQHGNFHCGALNLVPFADAWNTNTNFDGQQRQQQKQNSFASLLPTLQCPSLNSEGMLIHLNDDDDTNHRYKLYLATDDDDLPPITQLTLDVFDATAITLSTTQDWSMLERMVVEPMVGMYNSYAFAVGYTEVLSGLRKRMRNRLAMENNGNGEGEYDWLAPLVVPEPTSKESIDTTTTTCEQIAARSSLILALARDKGEGEMEVVASIEVRLQPTDAKIPFSQPWLDNLERKLVRSFPFLKSSEAMPTMTTNKSLTSNEKSIIDTDVSSKNPPLRPYLCNLAVSPTLRSRGIGRALCRIVEAIAHEKWGYQHMYLHVDPENDAARNLYEKEGYVDVGQRWNVVWAGGAEGISYYVKRLGGSK